jgi:O-acetyl-ADP-ribose deacetylase (regulator of RNase III)
MKIIYGDIFDYIKNDYVLIHGCNCFCNMGAGIARTIKENYFEAYNTDCKTIKGDKSKLGTYSSVDIKHENINFTIVNAYTQYHYGGRVRNADYNAIKAVFNKISVDFKNKTIIYPMIGAGLAGGDWEIISKIIDEELYGLDHICVIYKK